jgi:hypothetical protein
MFDYDVTRQCVALLAGGKQLPPEREKIAAVLLWHFHTHRAIAEARGFSIGRCSIDNLMKMAANYLADEELPDELAEKRATEACNAAAMIVESIPYRITTEMLQVRDLMEENSHVYCNTESEQKDGMN